MKKLIGFFDTKKMTPEQIFEKVKKSLEKQDKAKPNKKHVKQEIVTE